MKRLAGIMAVTLLIGAIAACGRGQDSVSGLQAVQYTLASIDGHALPHQISQSSDGSVTTAVTDMVLTIVEDNSWHEVGHETVTTNGVPSTEVFRNSGSYARSSVLGSDSATFRNAAGDLVWVGSVTDVEVSLAGADNLRWVFQR